MPSAKTTRKLWVIGIFVLPILAVKVASVMLGRAAPLTASATPADNPPPNPAARAPTAKWNERQLAAASHISALRDQPFGDNPLLYLEEPKVVVDEPDIVPVIVETPEEKEPEVTFALNAVMSGSRGKTALIDGRPYREGDRIKGSEWDVQSIDCDHRQVTLFNPERNRSKIVRVETPLPSDADQTGTSDN